ncbi:hypothetical protein Tco_0776613 [Tanacetum coccineum]
MVAPFEEHEQQENQDNLNEISKEKDDSKPPISTDTFGSNGGNDSRTSSSETPAKEVVDNGIESEVVVGLPEEFQKGDMVDALLRVEQKKGKENQLSWQHLAAIGVWRVLRQCWKRSPEVQAPVDNTVGDQEDSNMRDKQEVKNADDQDIKNVKDEEGKNVEDQQVSEQTINETANTITSLQSEVASLEAKGSLDANEEIKKTYTRVHELEKQAEKLLMELQLKNNSREALETKSKDFEKKMIDLNPTLYDL